ncbi:SRPBCC family protein [Pengzhenrongella frigida]|uniref:Uncharacterized protein n=1 Tax=Pengzhenrongella frigida TaxID=1259133 RepID=A0A4V1ZGQ8_9MICO|nr:SRPBCC family protein [Cellulomonas sp. HLT2-17]RYV49394.1 hypothetical protein EUA98_19010 [Cellulomonas sp. HLT2-17]
MSRNLLAERWERRRRARELEEQETAVARHARLPLVLVVEEVHLDLDCPADTAWRFVTDPANGRLLGGDPNGFEFVVPGSPRGEVGERLCAFTTRADGALIGQVEEVVRLEPGRLRVARSLSTEHAFSGTLAVVPLSDRTCRLSLELTAQVHPAESEAVREQMITGTGRVVRRASHHLAGTTPPLEPPPAPRPACRDASALVAVAARATVEVAVGPEVVWGFLLDAGNDRLDSEDPEAFGCTVPGTPSGQVGELRCVISHRANGTLVATLQEVVALDPQRSMVTRGRSTTHPAGTTLRLEASPTGTRLTVQVDLEEHVSSAEAARLRFVGGAEAHLARVKRCLEDQGDYRDQGEDQDQDAGPQGSRP